jgi:hypothetical protein
VIQWVDTEEIVRNPETDSRNAELALNSEAREWRRTTINLAEVMQYSEAFPFEGQPVTAVYLRNNEYTCLKISYNDFRVLHTAYLQQQPHYALSNGNG